MSESETDRTNREEDHRVIDVIRAKNMRMRPRSYFVLRAALIIVCATLLFLLLLYVVSFIIFALHQNGVWFAADFGPSGWSLFLATAPWGMLLLSFVLLILLANLLKRYTFIYHQPLFYFPCGYTYCLRYNMFYYADRPNISKYLPLKFSCKN